MQNALREKEVIGLKAQFNEIVENKSKILEKERNISEEIIKRISVRTMNVLNGLHTLFLKNNDSEIPISYTFGIWNKTGFVAKRTLTDNEFFKTNDQRFKMGNKPHEYKFGFYPSLPLIAETETCNKLKAEERENIMRHVKGYIPCVFFWLKDASVHGQPDEPQAEFFNFSVEFTTLESNQMDDFYKPRSILTLQSERISVRYETNWSDLLMMDNDKFRETIKDTYYKFIKKFTSSEELEDTETDVVFIKRTVCLAM